MKSCSLLFLIPALWAVPFLAQPLQASDLDTPPELSSAQLAQMRQDWEAAEKDFQKRLLRYLRGVPEGEDTEAHEAAFLRANFDERVAIYKRRLEFVQAAVAAGDGSEPVPESVAEINLIARQLSEAAQSDSERQDALAYKQAALEVLRLEAQDAGGE